MSVGPFIDSNNLIFGLETGTANLRHAKGQPGTNITTGVNLRWSGANNYTNFESFGFEEYVDIPTLGRRLVKSMNIYNTGGTCCPTLFGYGDSLTVSASTVYSYQIIYKVASGYTHPNFMYHYEFNGGTYITEYGVHSNSYRTHLGDGWYHAWNTFTTNASATRINTGLWYYQQSVRDKVSVAAISIAQGSSIRPASQIIESNTTRSGTQAYIDIKRNTSIDVSNMSFNSSGALVADGTDDRISLNPSFIASGLTEFSAEFYITDYGNTYGRNTSILYGLQAGGQALNIHLTWSNGYIYWDCGNSGDGGLGDRINKYISSSDLNASRHWVFTKNANTGYMRIYRNGVEWHSGTGFTKTLGPLSNVELFALNSSGQYPFGGTCEAVRMYDKELTSLEVARNYQAYSSTRA